jgi:ABC-type maltose transport system permease subunit
MNRSYYWLITALSIPAFLWLIPTLWMVSLSFQPNEVLARTTSTTAFGLIPLPFTAENYAALFSFGQTPLWFLNSAIVALGMTLGVLAVSTTAGYALARLEFPFKRAIMVLCLVGLMVPEQAVFIPLYTMFADLGWHNSYHALILPRMAVPIGVFLMMQFFRAIPGHRGGRAHRRRRLVADLLVHHAAAGPARHDDAGDPDIPICVERLSLAARLGAGTRALHDHAGPCIDPVELRAI